MSTKPHNLLLLFAVLAAVLGVQSTAEAGFVSPSVAAALPQEQGDALPFQAGPGAGAPAESEGDEAPRVEADRPAEAALFAPSGGPTGSMGSQSVSGSSSQSLTAASLADDPASAQLEVWLKVVKQPLHATHLKSRQFRPPRS